MYTPKELPLFWEHGDQPQAFGVAYLRGTHMWDRNIIQTRSLSNRETSNVGVFQFRNHANIACVRVLFRSRS